MVRDTTYPVVMTVRVMMEDSMRDAVIYASTLWEIRRWLVTGVPDGMIERNMRFFGMMKFPWNIATVPTAHLGRSDDEYGICGVQGWC